MIPSALLSMLQELGELKRVRSAGHRFSNAARSFRRSWGLLIGGTAIDVAMRIDIASAVAACRLGDLDHDALAGAGMAPDRIAGTLERSFHLWNDVVDPGLRARLIPGLTDRGCMGSLAPFVERLTQQPRAGATCPGRPRLVLEPPENHAEHCAVVAWCGVLLAPVFGADPVTVWLASLSHHLHNALLPDSGFTGEMLLGDQLQPVIAHATEAALAELPAELRLSVRQARLVLADAETPEGRAFHAADTLDRVWQLAQHLRPGQVTMDMILGDMALVHEGPTKSFQDEVLRAAGIAP